jgi:hypothetical protein
MSKKKIRKPSKQAMLGMLMAGCQIIYPDFQLCEIITKIILVLIVLLVGKSVFINKSLDIDLNGGINECIGYLLYVNTIDKIRIFSSSFDKLFGLINTPIGMIEGVANLFIPQNSQQNNQIIPTTTNSKNIIQPNENILIPNNDIAQEIVDNIPNTTNSKNTIQPNENNLIPNNVNKSLLKTFFYKIIEDL